MTEGQEVDPPLPVHARASLSKSLSRHLAGLAVTLNDYELGIPGHWPMWRKRAARILRGSAFELFGGLVITLNLCLIIVETNINAECRADNIEAIVCKAERYHSWLVPLDVLMLSFYTADAAARILVDPFESMKNHWTMFDLILVIAAFVSESYGQFPVNLLRLFRLARLGRGVRLIRGIPELYVMVLGLWGCMKTLFWGSLLLLILLAFWGIIMVEFLYPLVIDSKNEEELFPEELWECYSSIPNAMLTIFRTDIAGDSWGVYAIPLIRLQPWSCVIFLSAYFTIGIGSLNLVTAVVIETASKQPKNMKEQEQLRAKNRLKRLCKYIDMDNSGTISREELSNGVKNIDELRAVVEKIMTSASDIDRMFDALDEDGSGSISYNEFAENLYKIKTNDMQTILQLIRRYVMDLQKDVGNKLDYVMGDLGNQVRIPAENSKEIIDRTEEQKAAELDVSACVLEKHKDESPARSMEDLNNCVVELLQFLRNQRRGTHAIAQKEFRSHSSTAPSGPNDTEGVDEDNSDGGEKAMQERFDKIFDWIEQDKDNMYDKLLEALQAHFKQPAGEPRAHD